MKSIKVFIALLAIIMFSWSGCSDEQQSPVSPGDQAIQAPASLQKNNIRPFEGYEYGVSRVSPGVVTIKNNKQISKGIQYTTRFEATFTDGLPDLLTGDGFLELDGVLDLNTLEGHANGKLIVTPDNPDAGGVWEITWHSPCYWDNDKLLMIYPGKWIGHGKGGAINGMQLQGDDVIYYNPADPLDWYGDDGENCYVKEH